MTENLPYLIGQDSITVFDGEPFVIHRSHKAFTEVKKAIYEKRWEDVKELIAPRIAVKKYISDSGTLVLDGNSVTYKGRPVHNFVTDRLVDMMYENAPVRPMLNFLSNLLENPSKRSVDELLGFMEYGNLPLTADGHFLAYKRVDNNYKDCHSHSIDNSIGAKVSMPRNQVDDDKERTCSTGLHFCSYEYVKSFWGAHLMVVKINPKDVVSIPVDYNNTKGRCCAYEVVDELLKDARLEQAYTEDYNSDEWDEPERTGDTETPEDWDWDEEAFYDEHGYWPNW